MYQVPQCWFSFPLSRHFRFRPGPRPGSPRPLCSKMAVASPLHVGASRGGGPGPGQRACRGVPRGRGHACVLVTRELWQPDARSVECWLLVRSRRRGAWTRPRHCAGRRKPRLGAAGSALPPSWGRGAWGLRRVGGRTGGGRRAAPAGKRPSS